MEVAEKAGGEDRGDSGGMLGGGEFGGRCAVDGMGGNGHSHGGHLLRSVAHSDLRRHRPAAVWQESLDVLITRAGAKCRTELSKAAG